LTLDDRKTIEGSGIGPRTDFNETALEFSSYRLAALAIPGLSRRLPISG
jgi:hypothetical protein